jgi:hypothetical protein
MSRTYRSTTYHWLRRPKGRINAKRNNARAGAVPPDPWDDIPHGKECGMPFNIALKLAKRGMKRQEAVERISRKFHLAKHAAIQIAYDAYTYHRRRTLPWRWFDVYFLDPRR